MTYLYTTLIAGAAISYVIMHMLTRKKGDITVVDFFVFFVLFQVGPLAWFGAGQTYSGSVHFSLQTTERFLLGIFLMYVGLFTGLLLGRSALSTPGRTFPLPYYGADYRRLYFYLVAITVLYLLLLITIGSVRTQITTVVRYAMGHDLGFTYNELRRDVFGGDAALHQIHGRLRYSVTAGLFCVLLATGLYLEKYKRFTYGLAFALFMAGALSFSKLPFVWFLLYAVLVFFLVKQARGIQDVLLDDLLGKRRAPRDVQQLKRRKKRVVISVLLCFSALIGLYYFQYRENIERGTYGFTDIFDTALYRLFLVNADMFKHYVAHYPEHTNYLGGGSSVILSSLLGVEHSPPHSYLANVVYGMPHTTWPTWFIGDAYADFGLPGVAVVAFLVGVFVEILSRLATTIRTPPLRVAYVVACGLNTAWFVQLGAPTTLLTGGLGVLPFMFLLLDKLKPTTLIFIRAPAR